MTDVLICGAGIAGSALAIALARQGRHVLLLDRAEFPREKACGEGLMPAGVGALGRLGIQIEGAPFRGVRYHYRDRVVQGVFPNGAHALGIRRFHLDAALFKAASALVPVHTGVLVEAPLVENGRVVGVRGDGREFRARLTVAADGANSVLRHKLGWDASKPSRRYGLRRHYRGTANEWVEAYLSEDQETYITPLPNGEVLVASLGESPSCVSHLEPIDQPMGAAPLTVRASRRVMDGCVLLGDAAGNCDPITGSGMSQALLSAELFASYIDRGASLEAFDRARERMLTSYRRLTASVLALRTRPALIGPSLTALHHAPWLFSRLLGIAGGNA
jgi:flavin-dependent dehydrogenase